MENRDEDSTAGKSGDRFGYTEADIESLKVQDPKTGEWIGADEFRKRYPAAGEGGTAEIESAAKGDGKLGKLQRVDLRQVWLSEPGDFTPWLALAENLEILGEAIGIELELEAQEKDVGPFRADILCKDTETGSWVLIENQLGRTDHTHLGQLLTYASGLQAVSIVWIAANFTEEHRATLNWLNEITDERFNFFGLEVELWRIGDSLPAPKFNIIAKPNEWSRSVSQSAQRIANEALTETGATYLKYWQAFRDLVAARGGPLRSQEPRAQGWTIFGIGRSGIWLSAMVNSREERIGAELYINVDNAKAIFKAFLNNQQEIEKEFGEPLQWHELPERKRSRIAVYLSDCDPADMNDWPRQHAWLAEKLERLHKVFRTRVRTVD